MKDSNRFQLNKKDILTWAHNVVVFLAPLGVTYFGAIALLLQVQGHVFSTNDFIPSNFTLGAMTLYVVNSLFDLSRKYVAKK